MRICSGVGRRFYKIGHAVGTVNLATVKPILKRAGYIYIYTYICTYERSAGLVNEKSAFTAWPFWSPYLTSKLVLCNDCLLVVCVLVGVQV